MKSIFLISCKPCNKLKLIKTLKAYLKLSLKETKDISDSIPTTVDISHLNKEEKANLCHDLEEIHVQFTEK